MAVPGLLRSLGWVGGMKPEGRDLVELSPVHFSQVITRKVNIQVGDVNDNAPTFHNQPYSVRIPEVSAF